MSSPGERAFRRMLEAYVLLAIGKLESAEQPTQEWDDFIRRAGGSSSWIDFVEETMEFPPKMPELIREKWRESLDRFGPDVSPTDFSTQFVEANFT